MFRVRTTWNKWWEREAEPAPKSRQLSQVEGTQFTRPGREKPRLEELGGRGWGSSDVQQSLT